MRTVAVLECRGTTGVRYWAWCLLKQNPPGFDRVWFTHPGGGEDNVPDGLDIKSMAATNVFTYTTRESMVTEPEERS